MKIISKFHDYYDTVQSLGYDKSNLYKRETQYFDFSNTYRPTSVEQEFIKHNPSVLEFLNLVRSLSHFGHFDLKGPGRERWYVTPILTMVAGKFYPVLRWNVTDFSASPSTDNLLWIYDKASALEKLSQAPVKYSYEENQIKKREKKIDSFFEIGETSAGMELAIKNRWVAISHQPGTGIIIDPPLDEQELMRAVPPYQMAQEIEMFLSNLGNPEKPMIQIEDRYKIPAKGFNNESFRNTGGRMSNAKKKQENTKV